MSGIKKLYLQLSHGRDSIEEQMEGFGFEGPFIGPIFGLIKGYATVSICFEKENDFNYWKEITTWQLGTSKNTLQIPIVDYDLTPLGAAYYGYYSVSQELPKVVEIFNKKLIMNRLSGKR